MSIGVGQVIIFCFSLIFLFGFFPSILKKFLFGLKEIIKIIKKESIKNKNIK